VASESAEPDVERREFLIDAAVRNPLEPIELMVRDRADVCDGLSHGRSHATADTCQDGQNSHEFRNLGRLVRLHPK
jgi:hypothetical protein